MTPRETKTTADWIARRLGDDGRRRETADEVSFAELMTIYAVRTEYRTARPGCARLTRYQFGDGSAVVDVGGMFWDVEGATPFSTGGGEPPTDDEEETYEEGRP